MIRLDVENIGKRYERNARKEDLLVKRFFSAQSKKEWFWALKDIRFQLKEGETLGIIGSNGSGKSTLLKILSRVCKPTEGKAKLVGRVAPLLEVGTGFHPDLSGRENIFLNGTLLGMPRASVIQKLDEIIAFSGIESFIDTPVKQYSSGMYVRLAFAVAAHLDSEIVLVDEVLAVGDLAFQAKCLNKMQELSQSGRAVLLVTHHLESLNRLCDSALWLDAGRMRELGAADAVSARYRSEMMQRSKDVSPENRNDRRGTGDIQLKDLQLLDASGKRVQELDFGALYQFSMQIHSPLRHLDTLQNLRIQLNLFAENERFIGSYDSSIDFESRAMPLPLELKTDIQALHLIPGEYALVARLLINGKPADRLESALSFNITANARSSEFRRGGMHWELNWKKSTL